MRNKLISSLAGAVFSFAANSLAFAADIPVKAPPLSAPAPVYSWTAFYVGINAGWGWGHTSASVGTFDPATAVFFTLTPNDVPISFFNSSFSQSGAIGGAQVGYNWQFAGNWVAGLEADIQAAGVHGDLSKVFFLNPGFFGNGFPISFNTDRTLEWFGTVRGRLGFLATPNLLIYGTGGLSYGETKANGVVTINPGAILSRTAGSLSFVCSGFIGPCYVGSNSRTSVGWAAGAGLEYRAAGSNVTWKLEYLYIDLGDQTVTMVSPSPPSTPGVFMSYPFNREAVNIVRVGLNYQFH
jgi:outer membrane immunogenic protein